MKRSGTGCSEINLKDKNVNSVDLVNIVRPKRANHRNSLWAKKITSRAKIDP